MPPRVFRVYRDSTGNPIVPRGSPVVLPDGTVIGVASGDVVALNPVQARYEGVAQDLRIGTIGQTMMAVITLPMSFRTSMIGSFAAIPVLPTVSEKPSWRPLSVESGRHAIIRLLRRRMETVPKSAMERMLVGEEIV